MKYSKSSVKAFIQRHQQKAAKINSRLYSKLSYRIDSSTFCKTPHFENTFST